MELVHNQVALIIDDLDLHSYYQLLEVAQEDSASVVEFNYDTLRHEYDKLRNHDRCTRELREGLDLLLDRLEEAKQVLCDSRLRREYDERLALGETRHARAMQGRADDRAEGRPPGRSLETDAALGGGSRISLSGFDLDVPGSLGLSSDDPEPKESGQVDLSTLMSRPLPDEFADETMKQPMPPHHDPPPPVPEPALEQSPSADEELSGQTTNRFALGARPEAALRHPALADEETTRRDQRPGHSLPSPPDADEYVADDATDQDLQARIRATRAEETEQMVVVPASSHDESE
jgi:hypothetical protein